MATINSRIQFRTDTKSNWESANPVLLLNELVIEKQEDDSIKFKIGNGVSNYMSLNYISMVQGGIKILPKTINPTDWVDVQMGVWKVTASNLNITSTQYITVDASADEIIEHMTDTPIASLVVSTPTDGSVDIFVISDTKPTKQYDIRLIIQESSIIS